MADVPGPTLAQLHRWRAMLQAGEIRPRGFTVAEGLAWLDAQLTAHPVSRATPEEVVA